MSTITGTNANESLNGTSGNDDIYALAGDDIVHAGDGNDYVDAGSGNFPGSHDLLYGEGGDDHLVIYAADGSRANPFSLADGGAGNDVAELRFSNFGSALTYVHDTTYAEVHCGRVAAELANIESIIFFAGTASDNITGGINADELYGGAGNDILDGSSGNDVIVGATGDDVMRGGSGDDVLVLGSNGNDTIDGGAGNDTVDTGYDWVPPADGSGISLHLSQPTEQVNGRIITINAIENIIGTDYADLLIGADGDNVLSGQVGADTLQGLAGNDSLYGGVGDDALSGGDGSDRLIGGDGIDQVAGGAGDDVIIALGDGDRIDGGAGHDTLIYSVLARRFHLATANADANVGADHVTGVETIVFHDATLTFDPDSDAAFVMRLYEGALGRAPDPWGLDVWTDALHSGVSRIAVADGFLNSGEFQSAEGNLSDAAFVELLYNRVLGRPSDANGKGYWLDQLSHGMSRAEELLGFSDSSEHRSQTASELSNGLWTTDNNFQVVESLYHAFAGREPDLNGLIYWTDQLHGGEPLRDVASSFASSAEFVGRTAGLSNSELVEYMYHEALGRGSDSFGRRYWTEELDHGLSHGDLILAFATSTEHMISLSPHLFSGVDFII